MRNLPVSIDLAAKDFESAKAVLESEVELAATMLAINH